MLTTLILASALSAPPPPPNGCNGTCLNPALLPYGSYVVDGIAYADYGWERAYYYLGCDEDRPYNQQLAWHARSLWYYYPAAAICAWMPPGGSGEHPE